MLATIAAEEASEAEKRAEAWRAETALRELRERKASDSLAALEADPEIYKAKSLLERARSLVS